MIIMSNSSSSDKSNEGDSNSTALETQLQQLTELYNQLQERVTQIETQLMLLPDIDRYQQLQNFLEQGDIKAADKETARLMLEIAGEHRESLTPDAVRKFPCDVLAIIDRLWLKYSQGRFGFSVQLQTYISLGGSVDTLRTQDQKIFETYGEQVGWRCDNKWQGTEYDNWHFSFDAPAGCFPAYWWKSPYGLKMINYFFIRLLDCQL